MRRLAAYRTRHVRCLMAEAAAAAGSPPKAKPPVLAVPKLKPVPVAGANEKPALSEGVGPPCSLAFTPKEKPAGGRPAAEALEPPAAPVAAAGAPNPKSVGPALENDAAPLPAPNEKLLLAPAGASATPSSAALLPPKVKLGAAAPAEAPNSDVLPAADDAELVTVPNPRACADVDAAAALEAAVLPKLPKMEAAAAAALLAGAAASAAARAGAERNMLVVFAAKGALAPKANSGVGAAPASLSLPAVALLPKAGTALSAAGAGAAKPPHVLCVDVDGTAELSAGTPASARTCGCMHAQPCTLAACQISMWRMQVQCRPGGRRLLLLRRRPELQAEGPG